MGLFDAAIASGGISSLKSIAGKTDLGSVFGSGNSSSKSDTNVLDKDWLNQRFIAPDGKLPSHIAKNRFT
jgi:hypothetical protein